MDPGVALALDAIAELGRRASGTSLEGVPHPLTTSALLHGHLDAATDAAPVDVDTPGGRAAARAARPLLERQRAFNTSVLESLHQFDHRTRTQDEVIRELESTIVRLEQRVAELERTRPPS